MFYKFNDKKIIKIASIRKVEKYIDLADVYYENDEYFLYIDLDNNTTVRVKYNSLEELDKAFDDFYNTVMKGSK